MSNPMSNEKLGAEQGRVKRGTFAEIAANALGAAEMLNGPVVDATRVIEKVIQEVGPQIYAMAARAEQAYHARGAGREETLEKFREHCVWVREQSRFLAAKCRKQGDLADERKVARAYFNCATWIEEMFVKMPDCEPSRKLVL